MRTEVRIHEQIITFESGADARAFVEFLLSIWADFGVGTPNHRFHSKGREGDYFLIAKISKTGNGYEVTKTVRKAFRKVRPKGASKSKRSNSGTGKRSAG